MLGFLSIDLIELISNMLVFDPSNRWTFDKCLKSVVFDSIRNKNLEESVEVKTQYVNMYVDFNNSH
jgi:hypothetical protein